MSTEFSFIRGPFQLRVRERLTAAPGEVIVLEARNGVVAVRPGQRMSKGEARFARGGYWRVALSSPEQVLTLTAASATPRDEFRLEIHYLVDVTDAIALYQTGSVEVDVLPDIQLRVRSYARNLAARTPSTNGPALQTAIKQCDLDLPEFVIVRFPDVLVELTEPTRSRLDADSELEDRITERRRRAKLEEENEALEHESRTRREHHRFELISLVANQYGLQLDPLMMRALALDDHPSSDSIHLVRQRLLQEHYDGLNQFRAFFQALHEHQMLDDDGLAVFMEFAHRATKERFTGALRPPVVPPPRRLQGSEPSHGPSDSDDTERE